jgi:hypothetical protein
MRYKRRSCQGRWWRCRFALGNLKFCGPGIFSINERKNNVNTNMFPLFLVQYIRTQPNLARTQQKSSKRQENLTYAADY